ncbi:MAG: glycosyltransferase [Rikenellaceae bacterium]
MNIIIVGPAHPYRGGIADSNERLAHQYIQEGHTVEIVTFTLQYPSFLFPGKTQYSSSPAPKGLDIVRKINSINPINWLCVANQIARKKPDLVMMRFWLPFLAPCLGTIARGIRRKSKKTKIVSIVDNIVPHEKRFGDRMFARYFVGSIHGFISMSNSVLEDLVQFNKTLKPSLFSPHPLYDHFGSIMPKEQAAENLGLDKDFSYMLFFGIIRDYKGLDLLLEALALGQQRFRELKVKLIVAGEFYNNSQIYFELSHKLGIDDMIVWRNEFIPHEQVADYFSLADIVAQTYKSATQSGITQIAYHFERPMLVTHVGGLAEIVPHNKVGYVCDTEPKAISEALIDFYENDRFETFVEGTKSEKKRYAWDIMTARINELMTLIN